MSFSAQNLYLPHPNSGAHPASYPAGIRVSIPEAKAVWAWIWPHASI